jgi:hypothetical protein
MVNAYGCDQFDGFGSHVAAERTSTIHTKAIIEMACVASGSPPFTTTKRNCRAIHHHTKFGSFLGAECVDPVARPLVAPLFFYSFTLVAAYVVLSLFISVITSAMFEVRETKECDGSRCPNDDVIFVTAWRQQERKFCRTRPRPTSQRKNMLHSSRTSRV